MSGIMREIESYERDKEDSALQEIWHLVTAKIRG
jgi:hypothetical protein